jgi:hypothetical protein
MVRDESQVLHGVKHSKTSCTRKRKYYMMSACHTRKSYLRSDSDIRKHKSWRILLHQSNETTCRPIPTRRVSFSDLNEYHVLPMEMSSKKIIWYSRDDYEYFKSMAFEEIKHVKKTNLHLTTREILTILYQPKSMNTPTVSKPMAEPTVDLKVESIPKESTPQNNTSQDKPSSMTRSTSAKLKIITWATGFANLLYLTSRAVHDAFGSTSSFK